MDSTRSNVNLSKIYNVRAISGHTLFSYPSVVGKMIKPTASSHLHTTLYSRLFLGSKSIFIPSDRKYPVTVITLAIGLALSVQHMFGVYIHVHIPVTSHLCE